MSHGTPQSKSPAERVYNTARITRALRLAVRDALLDHKRSNHPIATWRDGKVVWIAPEDIEIDPELEADDDGST